MRTLGLGIAAAAVAAAVAMAPTPVSAAGPDHLVNGWGEVGDGSIDDIRVSISARSFGDAESASGWLRMEGTDYRMVVDVDCLRVDDATGTAWLSGNLKSSSGSGSPVGTGYLVIVHDDPGGDTLVGILRNPRGGTWPAPVCNSTLISTPVLFTRGDIRVR